MPRSHLAVGRARAKQHPSSQPRAAFTPRPASSLRQGGEGRGGREHRQPCQLRGEPPPQPGLRAAAALGKEPGLAPRWICCFCSPSIFPISPSLLTHTLWVSPSYLKHSARTDGICMGTSTCTCHHHPTEKRAVGAHGVSFSLGFLYRGAEFKKGEIKTLKKKAPI